MGGASLERFLWSPGGNLPPIEPNLMIAAPDQVDLYEEFDLTLSLDNIGPRDGLRIGISGEAGVFEVVEPVELPPSCVGCFALISIPPRELQGTVRIRSIEARGETNISAFTLATDGSSRPEPQATHSIEVRP